MLVTVRDNNIDQALRALKKKMQREGVFGKVKDQRFFTSKGERRRIAKAKGISRAFKTEVARVARDECIPKPEATKLVEKRRNRRSPR